MQPEDRDEETETPEDVPEGTEPPSGEETSQIDRIFVKFKSYIDDRLDSLIRPSSYSNEQDLGPGAESKVFKRETESMLKIKGNQRGSQRVYPRTSQEKRLRREPRKP